jgi:tight adherence protein C
LRRREVVGRRHGVDSRKRRLEEESRLDHPSTWRLLGDLGRDRAAVGAVERLAGDEGAKIRQSLMARAESMRRKELADVEGQAGENSQSMLVAQLLICAPSCCSWPSPRRTRSSTADRRSSV